MSETPPGRCYHCGEPIDPEHSFSEVIDGVERHFCCQGCLSACLIIYGAGEERYYEKRSFPAPRVFEELPAGTFDEETGSYVPPQADGSNSYIASFDIPSIKKEYVKPLSSGLEEIQLAIEGIHCSSCVFLNERILARTVGIHEAQVNYESGRATVTFDPEVITISQIISAIRSIGYDGVPLRPGQKSEAMQKEGRDLLWKMAFSGFFAGNVMLVSAALYFGFFDKSMTPMIKNFFHWVEFILTTPAFLFAGSVFHRGWKSFFKTGMAGMDLLISTGISVAYFYSVYLTLAQTGEVYFDSVTTIIFFLLIGRYFEWRAKYNQRLRMEELVRPLPQYCKRVRSSGEEELVAAADLHRDDTIRVRPDEYLPTDGTLLSDSCEVDESVLTGETLPVLRSRGDRILAGSRLVSGVIDYRVDSLPGESSLSILSRLADTAGMKKSRIEQVTLRIIPWFSNAILLIALGTGLAWYFFFASGNLQVALENAIAVLIISCPCALALAVPTAIGSSIYLGLTGGVLVRDGEVLERFSKIKTYLFDKTGTLTAGRPVVVDSLFPADGHTAQKQNSTGDLSDDEKHRRMRLVEKMEAGSAHPVGRALLEFVREELSTPSSKEELRIRPEDESRTEIPGLGITFENRKDFYRIGSPTALQGEGMIPFLAASSQTTSVPAEDWNAFLQRNENRTTVALASRNEGVLALFALEDLPAEGSREALDALRSQGASVHMLTGDSKGPAMSIASRLGIDSEGVHAGLLPEQKEEIVERFEEQGTTTCMIGDGYNDAVALSRSSVPVVLSRGAPLSLEHAGVILLQNDIKGLIRARRLAKKSINTIYLNLGISLVYNGIMIPVAAMGYLYPIWCALFMSLSSLTVVGISILLRLTGIPETRHRSRESTVDLSSEASTTHS